MQIEDAAVRNAVFFGCVLFLGVLVGFVHGRLPHGRRTRRLQLLFWVLYLSVAAVVALSAVTSAAQSGSGVSILVIVAPHLCLLAGIGAGLVAGRLVPR